MKLRKTISDKSIKISCPSESGSQGFPIKLWSMTWMFRGFPYFFQIITGTSTSNLSNRIQKLYKNSTDSNRTCQINNQK